MASQPVMAEEADDRMADNELAALLAAHEARAIGYFDNEIASEQARAISYYYGKMDDLPALEGCSSAVDSSVAVMVDNGLAAVLKPFVSADEVVSFEPRHEEDVAMAEQATEYVNYVINCDNPGFLIFHSWFKDGLLTKLGIVKCWWEDHSKNITVPVPVDAMGLMQSRQDPNYLDEQDNGDGTFTVSMQQTDSDGRVRIMNIPPEEFLISPFARSIEDAPYVAHRPGNTTRSDLIEMGFDAEIVEDLPSASPGTTNETRQQARYRDEQWMQATEAAIASDRSSDVIGVLDEYVRVDYDGDGIAELRRVIRVNDVILFNEEIEDTPFATVCPVPMPHKVYGRATADLAIQGQKIGTAVLRSTLDNLYKTNNPRPIVPDPALNESTFEDLNNSSPGAKIGVKVGGLLDWAVVPFMAKDSFPMLEYIAQQTEERTGFQRKGNGLNAEVLKKNSPDTATQAAMDENSRNERAEMVARIFAETGVKRLFKLILGLLVRHQPKARIIRLRNQWVPMDPSGWNPEMDVTISVGLGIGNKAEQMAQAQVIVQTMAEVSQTKFASLVNTEKAYNALKRLYTAAGIKNVDDFIVEPEKDEQGNVIEPEQPPDPEMAKAQADAQIQAAKLQGQQQEGALKLQLQAQDAAQQQQLAAQKAAAELQLAREKMLAEIELERERMAIQASLDQQQAERDHEVALAKNRSGGDLDK